MVLNLQMNDLWKGTEDESTDCGFEKGYVFCPDAVHFGLITMLQRT